MKYFTVCVTNGDNTVESVKEEYNEEYYKELLNLIMGDLSYLKFRTNNGMVVLKEGFLKNSVICLKEYEGK